MRSLRLLAVGLIFYKRKFKNMQITIKKRIGRETYTFLCEGKNLHELVMESQKLSFQDVDKCGLCQSDDLYLDARIVQNKFSYVEIKCASCMGSVIFGRKMENQDVFYLRKKNNVLDWNKKNSENSE